jgi:hypothetical protein
MTIFVAIALLIAAHVAVPGQVREVASREHARSTGVGDMCSMVARFQHAAALSPRPPSPGWIFTISSGCVLDLVIGCCELDQGLEVEEREGTKIRRSEDEFRQTLLTVAWLVLFVW